jgi:uncharacterized protein with NRDE domain
VNNRGKSGLHKAGGFCKRLGVCTLALYFQASKDFPLIVAANRDEHYDRPSAPPEVLRTEPKVLAGRDIRAGGTWLGVNDQGVLAAVLNRRSNGSENTAAASRSRGLLCLDLLAHKSAAAGRDFLAGHQESYQPFTLVFADSNDACFAFNAAEHIKTVKLTRGLHVFSNAGMHDEYSEKRQRAYGLFDRIKPEQQKLSGPLSSWIAGFKKVLSDHTLGDGASDPRDAVCIHGDVSGTVSSSVIVYSGLARRFRTFYCAGAPCRNDFSEAPVLDAP